MSEFLSLRQTWKGNIHVPMLQIANSNNNCRKTKIWMFVHKILMLSKMYILITWRNIYTCILIWGWIGFQIPTKHENLLSDNLWTIHVQFGFNLYSSIRELPFREVSKIIIITGSSHEQYHKSICQVVSYNFNSKFRYKEWIYA